MMRKKRQNNIQEDTEPLLEWVQCFGIYTAVISKSQPERAADLLGYQTLIIQVSQSSHDDDWLGYDRTFRLKAAARKNLKWADTDNTLWHVSFSAQGNSHVGRCKHCLSLYHTSAECSWDSGNYTSRYSNSTLTRRSAQSPTRVCYQWNADPAPQCPFRNCKFTHKCSLCISDPEATDTCYKAIYCPRNRGQRQPLFSK